MTRCLPNNWFLEKEKPHRKGMFFPEEAGVEGRCRAFPPHLLGPCFSHTATCHPLQPPSPGSTVSCQHLCAAHFHSSTIKTYMLYVTSCRDATLLSKGQLIQGINLGQAIKEKTNSKQQLKFTLGSLSWEKDKQFDQWPSIIIVLTTSRANKWKSA